jgi:high-affinity iron transporter
MIASYLLSLREGLEAALIIGIVLGLLGKLNRRDLPPLVWLGAICAGVVSLSVAVLLQYFGATLQGRAEELFEGLTMLLAAGILTWMIFWMRRQSRTLQSDLEEDVRRASKSRSRSALFLIAFLAVSVKASTRIFNSRFLTTGRGDAD